MDVNEMLRLELIAFRLQHGRNPDYFEVDSETFRNLVNNWGTSAKSSGQTPSATCYFYRNIPIYKRPKTANSVLGVKWNEET